jgi:hypothetical protein
MYMSRAIAAKATLTKGLDDGLTAAAENVTKKIRERLDRGYTTGAFSHHARGVAGRVMYTKPFDVPGGRAITLGTSKVAGYPYELAWELGHINIFVGRGDTAGKKGPRGTSIASRREGTYMRVEIWRPTLEANRDLVVRIIARNIARVAA